MNEVQTQSAWNCYPACIIGGLGCVVGAELLVYALGAATAATDLASHT